MNRKKETLIYLAAGAAALLAFTGALSLWYYADRVAEGVWIEGRFETWGHDLVLGEESVVLSDSFAIDVYTRGDSGYFIAQELWTDNVSFLAYDGTNICAVEEYGRVWVLVPAGDRLFEVHLSFQIPPDELGFGNELFAAAWDGDHLVVGGRMGFNDSAGILRVIALNGSVDLANVETYFLPARVTDIERLDSGFAIVAEDVFLLDAVSAQPNTTLVGPLEGFSGARKVGCSASGCAVAGTAGDSWPTAKWRIHFVDLSWRETSNVSIEPLMSGPFPWVSDLEYFGDAVWLAIRDAPLYRLWADGRSQALSPQLTDFRALDADGGRVAALQRKEIIIFGERRDLFPAIGFGVAVLASPIFITIALRLRERQPGEED